MSSSGLSRRALYIVLLTVPATFGMGACRADVRDGWYTCADGRCPAGRRCIEGVCRSGSTSPGLDAGAGGDAGPAFHDGGEGVDTGPLGIDAGDSDAEARRFATLEVRLEGDGVGRVDLGGECPWDEELGRPTARRCARTVLAGERISLVPQPGRYAAFTGFAGEACAGVTERCEVTVDANLTVTATFEATHNLAFLTSEHFSGDAVGGTDGADAHCRRLALAAGLGDHGWVAWVSTATADAIDRVPTAARGWIRVDGMPFADQRSDLAGGRVLHPLSVTEVGALGRLSSGGAPPAWSATGVGGRYVGASAPAGDCQGWTSSDGTGRVGLSRSVGGAFVDAGLGIPCAGGGDASLYCLGTDRGSELLVARETGRLAFLSEALVFGDIGIAAADALCQREAEESMRAGRFRAYLMTSSSRAHERFDLRGMPWVRVDGVTWMSPASSLSGGDPRTGLVLGARGHWATGSGLFGPVVFTGGVGYDDGVTATCENWSSREGIGMMGFAARTEGWDGAALRGCGDSAHLYCLEE